METLLSKTYDQAEIYYVYGHYKPGTDEIFYVGKGKNRRAWSKHRTNKRWRNTTKKYCGFDVRILLRNLKEYDSLCLEAMYINAYGRADLGRGPLVNLTDGGDGVGGYHQMPDHKAKIGDGNRGKKQSLEQRQNTSKRMKGNIPWNIGRTEIFDHEALQKNREAHIGRVWAHNIENTTEKTYKNKENVPAEWILGRILRNVPSRKKGLSKYYWKLISYSEEIVFNNCEEIAGYVGISEAGIKSRIQQNIIVNGYRIELVLK